MDPLLFAIGRVSSSFYQDDSLDSRTTLERMGWFGRTLGDRFKGNYAREMAPHAGSIAFAFDVEATGLRSNRQILQLAGLPLGRDLAPIPGVKPLHILLKPAQDIEEGARRVMSQGGLTEDILRRHGVNVEDARRQVVGYFEELTGRFGKLTPMGHGVQYDIDSLRNLIGDDMDRFFVNRKLDSLHAAAFYRGATGVDLPSLRLGNVAKHLGVPLSQAHDAIHDVFASVGVYRRIRDTLGVSTPVVSFNQAFADFPTIERVSRPSAKSAQEGVEKLAAEAQGIASKAKRIGVLPAVAAGAVTYFGLRSFLGPSSSSGVRIQGIRQSYPTGYNEFEVMKPHPEAGFPGGRLQQFSSKLRGSLKDLIRETRFAASSKYRKAQRESWQRSTWWDEKEDFFPKIEGIKPSSPRPVTRSHWQDARDQWNKLSHTYFPAKNPHKRIARVLRQAQIPGSVKFQHVTRRSGDRVWKHVDMSFAEKGAGGMAFGWGHYATVSFGRKSLVSAGYIEAMGGLKNVHIRSGRLPAGAKVLDHDRVSQDLMEGVIGINEFRNPDLIKSSKWQAGVAGLRRRFAKKQMDVGDLSTMIEAAGGEEVSNQFLRGLGFDAKVMVPGRFWKMTEKAKRRERNLVIFNIDLLNQPRTAGRYHGATYGNIDHPLFNLANSKAPQGIRRSRGKYDKIDGINLTPNQKALVPFGSGRNALTQFFKEAGLPDQPWIQASTLGFTEQERITDRYKRSAEQVRRSSVSVGADVHKMVQRLIRSHNEIEGIEVPVSDFLNKVYGNVDIMLKGGIPVEIKTVATVRDLRRMNRGKASAVSQANFYAIASGAPFAYLVYATREESDEFKIFKVPTDYGLYQADIARLRAGIQDVPGETIRVNTPQLNMTQLWNYLTGPSPGVRLFHPFRGLGGRPHNEITAIPQLGDYGRIYAETFRRPRGGQVQYTAQNALKSKVRSQHCRTGYGKVKCTPHPIGSRAGRGVAAA